jgi:predicted membrane-bound mannosyltransferase/sugar lactone lactonase YvrE
MAEATLERGFALPKLSVAWLVAHKEIVAVGALMAIAAGLRFWALGDKALHHDESLHAQYTWYLYSGRGYEHNPLMHGPFLFHSGALIFFLFGDSDYTTRVLPALFGTVLVGMPFLLRKQIGMRAVLIAAVLLTVSPTLLYVSRFYRDEMYVAVWTMGMVICIWRYLDEQRQLYLYALAALLALSFATMEVTFIHAAIVLVFLDIMLAVELGKRRDNEEGSDPAVWLRTAAIAPIAWLIAGLWPLLGRKPFGREKLPPVGDLLIVVGTLSLPQFSAAVQALPFVGDRGYDVASENNLRDATVLGLLVVSVYAGLLWRPKAWAICAAFFFVPYVLLYTTFFTNMNGFFSGIWGSLDYWLAQQDVRRGNQPGYYYALLTPLYEFLPLILAACGAIWLALRGDSLRRWLVFWLATIFIAMSLAGEKMPWLETYIALPLALVAAISLAGAVEALEVRGKRWFDAAIAGVITATGVMLVVDGDGVLKAIGIVVLIGVAAGLLITLGRDLPESFGTALSKTLASKELWLTAGVLVIGAGVVAFAAVSPLGWDIWFALWVLALIPVAIVGHLLATLMRGSKSFGRGVLAVGVAALLTLTVRASITLSFKHADIPVEMLVYTQTAPDIVQLRNRIDALAKNSGLGHNLPIVVDGADSFAWPWAWYLRDYHNVSFVDVNKDYQPPAGAVLLINRSNAQLITDSTYTQVPYKHRWWFNETYRELNFHDAASIVTSSKGFDSLLHFFLYRRPAATTTGSVDGVAFFPSDLSAFDYAPGPGAAPREPARLGDGRILIGGQDAVTGARREGEFWQPTGLFVDKAGNLWVADSRNNRVQEFDSQGNFVAAFGRAGSFQGGFNEPWSLAVDGDGNVYVADTWNHRIEKFGPDFQFTGTWGQPTATASPGLYDMFGPRDILIAADGTLWITDTGNKRLLHYSAAGEALGAYGSEGAAPGQFSEPVGLAQDAAGNIYVADTWNGRIQRFTSEMQPAGEFPVAWTSRDVLSKPYLAVLSDGRILTTDPATGVLLLFDAQGKALGSWKPLPDSEPVGVAALPDGGFAFSDTARNEIEIVPRGLIENFFK